MRVRQLGSSLGGSDARQFLTTFLINDAVAIDAGCLGLLAPVELQQGVQHVFLSHSHLDHVATLPLFLDNVYAPGSKGPQIYAGPDVWACLRQDMLNERLWPDLERIADQDGRYYSAVELVSETPISVAGLTITPVAVDHVVPTLGFLIEDDRSGIIIASDTGPTDRIWELANRPSFRKKLRAVFLECSFPDAYEWLAEGSKHLCPKRFAGEIAKLTGDGDFLTVAVHLKAALYEPICAELAELPFAAFEIGGGDRTWEF